MTGHTHGYIRDDEFVMTCDNGHVETRMDRTDGPDGTVTYRCPTCGLQEKAMPPQSPDSTHE